MAKPQIQSRSYLVSPKDRSKGRSYFSFLSMIFPKISGHLFAFLLTIVSCIGILNPPQILQDDLNSLAQWEVDWQMKFNVAKCHSMRVTRHPPDKHIQFEYTLHQQRLVQVQSAKYLGITISDDMDWGQHISEISSKATKTLGFLRRNLAFAPRHTKEVAYKTLVRPKLRLDRWRRYRGQLPGGPAGDGETPVASATCLTILSGHPWRPAGSGLP